MANGPIDENGVHGIMGVSSSDGRTVNPVKVTTSTHRLQTADGSTGSDLGPTNAPRDENDSPTLLAVSSVDGTTPVVVYTDGSGRLLTQST